MYNKEKVQNDSGDLNNFPNKKHSFMEISPTATMSTTGEVAQGALGALSFDE